MPDSRLKGSLPGCVHLMAIVLALTVIPGCNLDEPPSIDGQRPRIIDYRQPYVFDSESEVNRLLIEVESRMTVSDGSRIRRYLLLSPHPRETTFEESSSPYRTMLERSGGGSEITFIHSLDDGTSIVSRRFENPGAAAPDVLHECRPSNHSDLEQPADLGPKQVEALTSTANIIAAAQARRPIVGRLDYMLDRQTTVSIDFPIRLVNIRPSGPLGSIQDIEPQWQVVSARLPLFIGDPADICKGTRPAVFAFRSFSGRHSAVQLCLHDRQTGASQDFSCPVEVEGELRLYAVIADSAKH